MATRRRPVPGLVDRAKKRPVTGAGKNQRPVHTITKCNFIKTTEMRIKKVLIAAAMATVCCVIMYSCSQQPYSLRFALLTDLHVSPGQVAEEHLQAIVDDINRQDLDLVVITGDITNTGSNSELDNVKRILNGLQGGYLIIPGNHETNWSESAGEHFNRLWGDDKFIEQAGDFVLIGFNTGPYMRMGDGHVRTQDIRWIEQQLQAYMDQNKRLLVFAHYPLAPGLDRWPELAALFKAHHARVAFSGHGHQLRLLNAGGIPGVMGRSLVLRGGDTPGYTLIKLAGDSLWAWNKLAGEPAGAPSLVFNYLDSSVTDSLPFPELPPRAKDYGHRVTDPFFQWQDSVSVFTGPLVIGDTLLVYGNSAGWFRAIDLVSPSETWATELGGNMFGTPALAGETIVAGTTDSILYGLDVSDGSVRWSLKTGSPVMATPLVKEGDVYVGFGNRAFACVDAASGAVQWSFDGINGYTQARAAVSGNVVVFTAWDTHVYALDRHSGQLLWAWNNDSPVKLFSPGNVQVAISHDKVFLVAPDRYMTALDLKSGTEIWRTGRYQVRESMGVSHDKSEIYAKLMNDNVIAVCASSSEFKTNWIADAGFGYDHNPVPLISDARWVYLGTNNGIVMALDRRHARVDRMVKTGNSAVNGMMRDGGGRIWFTTADGRIVGW